MTKSAHSRLCENASTARRSPGAVRRCGRPVWLPRHPSGSGKDDTSSGGWIGSVSTNAGTPSSSWTTGPGYRFRSSNRGYRVSLDGFITLCSKHDGCWDNVVSTQSVEHVVIGRSADG